MPSSATITSFYTFAANSKARAAQVNTNFSNFRGHVIAIDPHTATSAATETYDLGSTEYRWRTGYFREVDLKSNTSTGQSLQIVGDTAAGQNAFLMKSAGNIRARLGGGNQYIDVDTTTSQFDFKFAGVTVASIKSDGIQRTSIPRATMYSTTITAASVTNTVQLIGTLSMTSYGKTVKLGINLSNPTTGSESPRLTNNGIGTGANFYYIYRDGTAPSNLIYLDLTYITSGTATGAVPNVTPTIDCYDSSVTSGAHTYYLYAKTSNTDVKLLCAFDSAKFQCIELI